MRPFSPRDPFGGEEAAVRGEGTCEERVPTVASAASVSLSQFNGSDSLNNLLCLEWQVPTELLPCDAYQDAACSPASVGIECCDPKAHRSEQPADEQQRGIPIDPAPARSCSLPAPSFQQRASALPPLLHAAAQ